MMHSLRKGLYRKSAGNKQDGVALITALLIVALATIMAVALTSRQYIDIRRTGNMMASDQAYLDAIAAETFVSQLLANFRSQQQTGYDDVTLFTLALTQLSGDMSDDNRLVSVQAVYPEAKFNVNTLIKADGKVNEPQKEIYQRLLSSVISDLGGDTGQVSSLVSSLVDWIDENQEETGIDGAEDSAYESKDPPYKAANRLLASITELRLVEGYTPELLDGIPADEEQEIEAINGLLAYVDALPDIATTINVNSVSDPKIFMALSGYLDKGMADDLISKQPFKELNDFRQNETFDSIKSADQQANTRNNYTVLKEDINKAKIDLQSSYFLIKTNVVVGKTVMNLNSLVYVKTDGTKLEVISRAIGTDGI